MTKGRKHIVNVLLSLTILLLFFDGGNLTSKNLFLMDSTERNKKESVVIKDSAKKIDSDFDKPGKPYDRKYSPYQDSVYYKAMRMDVPVISRLKFDYEMFSRERRFAELYGSNVPARNLRDNMNIDPEILKPTGRELVQRQEMINNAFYVPYMPNRITNGFSVSLADVGAFLGLTEDVSPVISFKTKYAEEIEIVIYSMQAITVRTLFKGYKPAGSHKFEWNGRDDEGRPMPSGDYVAEVRIGKTRFYRKRIHLP